MNRIKLKSVRHARRDRRVRKNISGTPDRFRLTVFRSLNHVYAQVIDDLTGTTLASASTRDKGFPDAGAKMSEATAVGRVLRFLDCLRFHMLELSRLWVALDSCCTNFVR